MANNSRAGLDLGTSFLPIDHLDPVFHNISYTVSKKSCFAMFVQPRSCPNERWLWPSPILACFCQSGRYECNRLCGSLAGRGRTPNNQTTYPPACSTILQYFWLTGCFSVQRQGCDYLIEFSQVLSSTHTEHWVSSRASHEDRSPWNGEGSLDRQLNLETELADVSMRCSNLLALRRIGAYPIEMSAR